MTYGENVANRRRELGISQKTLAETLGISPGYLSKIERNRMRPSYDVCNKIYAVLSIHNPEQDAVVALDNNITLEILEKRVTNAIYELEILLDYVKKLKNVDI